MKHIYNIYDASEGAIHEEVKTGLLTHVINNSVVASASPDRISNYKRLADMRGTLLSRYYTDGNSVVVKEV